MTTEATRPVTESATEDVESSAFFSFGPEPTRPVNSAGREAAESSSIGLSLAPVLVGMASIAAGAVYSVCAYRSFNAFRRDNPEASTCRLIRRSLTNPMYFRHIPQNVGATMQADDADDIEEQPAERQLMMMSGEGTRGDNKHLPSVSRDYRGHYQQENDNIELALWVN